MNELISKSEKMTSLLKEYKESLIYENCKYHLIKDENCKPMERYFLYLIEGQKQLLYCTKEKIKQYLSIRNIDTKTVYNYSIITI